MGFTGEKAMRFKVDYIRRFNDRESFIVAQYAAKMEHPAFTDAVMMAHDEPKHYHFSNETDMINKIVIGMTAKQFKEAHGLVDVPSIRPHLTSFQISDMRALQIADVGLLAIGMEYQERKSALASLHDRRKILEIGA
jgi:hypothetical protein